MSRNPALEPHCPTRCPTRSATAAIVTLVVPRGRDPRVRDIGQAEARRALPSARRRTVGPFIFFDRVGSFEFPAVQGNDVQAPAPVALAIVRRPREDGMFHLGNHGPLPGPAARG